MITTLKLLRVKTFPSQFEPGILYFSKEYEVAGHLCPCGCDNKIITPIETTEWSLSIRNGKPTLYPSLGNWELPCRSHYWIRKGKIERSYDWTDEEIEIGRKAEERERKKYYDRRKKKSKIKNLADRVLSWLFKS
jgi:hypothetical protein